MRYIDADLLKHHYSWWDNDFSVNYSTGEGSVKKLFDCIIDQQPTADVVEIVRCEDCKHCEIRNNDEPICHFREEIVEANEFCSFGEEGRWTP